MKRAVLSGLLAVLAVALLAAPAGAYWKAGGAGTGTAPVGTLAAGSQPSVTVSAQSVMVTWTQATFQGNPLGSLAGGGYSVKRYPAAGGSAVTPNTACNTTVTGAATTLTCTEAGTPLGSWQYAVTPVLNTWTGAESTKSATASVVPTVSSATAQNPATGQTTGSVQVSWSAATGATGYNVYRRTSSGAYNYATPLNGSTPLTGTSYTDPGSGLSAGTTYSYVVRGIQGSESPSSSEVSATVISRPAAPASATATAAAAAQVGVTWPAVSGAAGYNVYRRLSTGSYNYSSPLNGATPVTSASYTDTTTVAGTSYRYVVRTVITGASSAQVESADSSESAAVTADGSAPAAPTALTVGSGAGSLLSTAKCSFTSGTRFVNNGGAAAVPVTATIATPETGETVIFSAATTGAAVTKTVSATTTSVSTTMDLSSLADGTVTLTARTVDAAGNQSATKAPTNAIVKDTVSQLGGLTYVDLAKATQDTASGTSECGATVSSTQTVGPHVGKTASLTVTAADGTFSGLALDAINGSAAGVAYAFTFSTTDLAGNTSPTLTLSGTDTK